MSRRLSFTKMHGAGNDFIMVDGRDLEGCLLSQEQIAGLCHRQKGIGADGLIIIGEPTSSQAQFQMVYFNSDGGQAEMCGNGARCSVAFAHDRQLIQDQCFFDTMVGTLEGRVLGPSDIQVSLPVWKDLKVDLDLGKQEFPNHHTCNTGVPHLVIPLASVENIEIEKQGAHYRYLDHFSPAGTNVNFVTTEKVSGRFQLRTYERGVEAETLACGTGASAAAVVLCQLGLASSPVALQTRGGDLLEVSVDFDHQTLLLRGPAETSFQGEVMINE